MKKHNVTMDELLFRCGRNPCIATKLALKILPYRDPRSVYNFIRRRLRQFKSGPWQPQEVLTLIESHINAPNNWRVVAKILNRSPEQVQSKWRELQPNISHLINEIQASSSNDDKLRMVIDYLVPNVSFSRKMEVDLYNLAIKNVSGVNDDISWKTIQSTFPNYPQSRLRLHFYMCLVPRVLKLTNPDFSALLLGRYILYRINKLFKNPTFNFIGLKDIPYNKFCKIISLGYQQRCLIKLLRRTPGYSRDLTGNKLKNVILSAYNIYNVKYHRHSDKKVIKSLQSRGLPSKYPIDTHLSSTLGDV